MACAWHAILYRPRGNAPTVLDVITSAPTVSDFIIAHPHITVLNIGLVRSSSLLGFVKQMW